MTLPYEEVNSLKAVRKFLYDLLDPSKTPRVPKAIRLRAHRLSKHYPMDYSIQERYPDVAEVSDTRLRDAMNRVVARYENTLKRLAQSEQEDTMTENNTTTTTRKNYLAEIADQYLTNGETITVTFTKKDGTARTMLCTRNMAAIPEDKHPKGEGKTKAAHLIVAFDLDKGEWRSFGEESLKSVQRGSMLHESV
jgi:predicted DNA-binding protein YlxM (UPF0122 family)